MNIFDVIRPRRPVRREGFVVPLPTQRVAPALCGPTAGRCPEGECCSGKGECGMTAYHCRRSAYSQLYNGAPSSWRCARGVRGQAPCVAPTVRLGCGPLTNQFCPWSRIGPDSCCLKDVNSLNGSCVACDDLSVSEQSRVWMYDDKESGWFTETNRLFY